MAENILKRLVNNSQVAIDDGTYDVECNLEKSSKDFLQIIKTYPHATLLTEIKFSSPSLVEILWVSSASLFLFQHWLALVCTRFSKRSSVKGLSKICLSS